MQFELPLNPTDEQIEQHWMQRDALKRIVLQLGPWGPARLGILPLKVVIKHPGRCYKEVSDHGNCLAIPVTSRRG